MSTGHSILLFCMLLCAYAALSAIFGATSAVAQPGLPSGSTEVLPGISIDAIFNEMQGGAFTVKVVMSVKEILFTVLTDFMLKDVYAILAPAISAAIVLAVALAGLNMATGMMRRPLLEISLLAIKVFFVYEFTRNLAFWLPGIMDVTESLMSIVSITMSDTVFGCELGDVPADLAASGLQMEQYVLWAQLDCVFLKFLGLSAAGSGISVMFGFLVSTAFSGYLGVYITTAGISAFTGLLFTILRCTYMYVSSLIAVAFLLILSPLFMPLILFKATTGYFEKWLAQLSAFLLQPVIISAFVALMLQVYTIMLFTGEYSLSNALFCERVTDVKDFKLESFVNKINNKVLKTEGSIEPVATQGHVEAQAAGSPARFLNIFGAGEAATDSEVPTGAGVDAAWDVFDPGKLCGVSVEAGSPEDNPQAKRLRMMDRMEQILLSFTLFILVTLCMSAMLQMLDSLTMFLVGRSFRLSVSYYIPGEQGFQSGMRQFKATAERGLGFLPGGENAAGAYGAGLQAGAMEFARQLPVGGGLITGAMSQNQMYFNETTGRYESPSDKTRIGQDSYDEFNSGADFDMDDGGTSTRPDGSDYDGLDDDFNMDDDGGPQ